MSQSEITDTLHKCHYRKHSGGDDKPVEAQNTDAEEGKVAQHVQLSMKDEEWSNYLKTSIFAYLIKKGDKQEC